MNWKFIIVATLFFLSIGFATAITAGQTVTWAQFNNHDFGTENFNYSLNNKYFSTINGIKHVNYEMNYLTLDYNEISDDWLVVENSKKFTFNLSTYTKCREFYSKDACLTNFKSKIQQSIIDYRNRLRNYYEDKQVDYSNELTIDELNVIIN